MASVKNNNHQAIGEAIIWVLASIIFLGTLVTVNLSLGLKPVSSNTAITWVTHMASAFLLRNIWGVKGTSKGKDDNGYKSWRTLVSKNFSVIRRTLSFKQKKAFCKEATKREAEQVQENLLLNNNIDDYFYEQCKKQPKNKREEWLNKQKEENYLTGKQVRALKRILIVGITVKPYNVNQLNSSSDKQFKRVYDLKDHTNAQKRKDLLKWFIVATLIFGVISSIVINGNANGKLILLQTLLTLISLTWNSFNSYIKHVGYMINNKVEFFQSKNTFLVDAGEYNGITMHKSEVTKDENRNNKTNMEKPVETV